MIKTVNLSKIQILVIYFMFKNNFYLVKTFLFTWKSFNANLIFIFRAAAVEKQIITKKKRAKNLIAPFFFSYDFLCFLSLPFLRKTRIGSKYWQAQLFDFYI